MTQVIDNDSAFLLRASRLAGLGPERDKLRLSLLGQEVLVQKADSEDMTVQVGDAFFPLLETLVVASCMLSVLYSQLTLYFVLQVGVGQEKYGVDSARSTS